MFQLGFYEILVIGLIALIVVGPERLPDLARFIGRLWGQFNRAWRGLQSDLDELVDKPDLPNWNVRSRPTRKEDKDGQESD